MQRLGPVSDIVFGTRHIEAKETSQYNFDISFLNSRLTDASGDEQVHV